MTVVLDASALVSLFMLDSNSARMRTWSASAAPVSVVLIDLAAVEFAAALTKAERAGHASAEDVDSALTAFDAWRKAAAVTRGLGPADIAVAEVMVRDRRTKLTAPDATYIAVAQADSVTLITFDERQAAAAHLLGVICVVPP